MQLNNVGDILKFVQYLNDIADRPWYRLSHDRYDGILVEIHMAGLRLEVEFLDDRVEYSLFEGDESVHDDQAQLFALLEKNRS